MGISSDLHLLAASELNYRHRVERLERMGRVAPNPTMREVMAAEKEMRQERRQRTRASGSHRAPMPVWTFWTLGVLAVLLAVTVVGIPVSILLAVGMWWKHPWRAAQPADVDAPTVTLPTVTDPVEQYDLAAARPVPMGRHAR